MGTFRVQLEGLGPELNWKRIIRFVSLAHFKCCTQFYSSQAKSPLSVEVLPQKQLQINAGKSKGQFKSIWLFGNKRNQY